MTKQIDFMVKVRLNSALREEGTNGVGVNEKQKGVVDTQESSQKSSQKIISLMMINPQITTQEIADKLGVSRRAITKQITTLREQGIIRRVGPDKGGHWEIVNTTKK